MKLFSWIAFALLLIQNAPENQSPASIDGVVVSWGTNVPIANADVELRRVSPIAGSRITLPPDLTRAQLEILVRAGLSSGVNPVQGDSPASTTMTTSGDGRFSFRNVPPGEYRVYATRGTTYIPGEYGQRSPVGTGIPLTLAPGQTASNIRLSMTPPATIAGRIVDADGDPVADARVNALRIAYQEGERILLNARSTVTDDRGEYRLSSLPPGQYYVASRPFEGRSSWTYGVAATGRFGGAQGADAPLVTLHTTDSGTVIEETWRFIFYPSAPDARSSQTVTLRPGENLRGIDINLAGSETPAWRVRGIVTNGETGLPVSGATVRLLPRYQLTPSVIMPSGVTDKTGRFDVPGVLSGSYSLVVNSNPGLFGYMVVDVGNSSLDGFQIVVTKGFDIPYTATMHGGTMDPAVIGRLRFSLDRKPIVAGQPTGSVVTTAGWPGLPSPSEHPASTPVPNGGYMLRSVPVGEYSVNIAGIPPGAYLKSITMGRSDVLADGLHVTSVMMNPIEIVFGDDSGVISGRVTDQNREAATNVTTVLVPDPARRSRMDLFQNAATDGSGGFRFQGIAPGEYKLFAWEDVADGAWFDAEFMRSRENVGTTVRIGAGNNDPVNLKVIPWNSGTGGQ